MLIATSYHESNAFTYLQHNRYKGQTRCFDDWKAKLLKHPLAPWQVKLNMKCCFQVSWSIHCLNKHKTNGQMYMVKSRLRSLMRHWKALFKDVVPQELIINRHTRINYLHPRPWWEVVILKFQLLSIAHENLWFHIQLHFVVVWCGMLIGFLFFIF